MTKVLVTESSLSGIANAIRSKNGSSDTYRPGDMAAAVQALDTSGIHPTGTKQITANGITDVMNYASVNVNVQPNLQTKTATQNGTVTPDSGYDGLSSVVVDVSGGGGSSGIYVGRDAPSANLGSDGNYYYRRASEIDGFTGALSNNSSTKLSGNEFIPNININVAGLRGYVRANTTGRLLIADTAGEIIAELSNISFTTGWNRVLFDTPIQLVANQNYIVAIEVGSTVLSYTNASNIQFDSSITYVRGRYGSIPGTQDAGIVYGADIIIDPGYEIVYEQYYKANGEWIQIG